MCPSVHALVGETNDSDLNDIRGLHITRQHVLDAIGNAKGGPVEEGSVGAGTGTTVYGWKGGIGTSSRVLPDGNAVLDRALEDRRISKDEAAALRDTAIEAGLSSNDVKAANETYLRSLISVALHDHVVTESERRDIDEVAHLLSLKAELPDLLGKPSTEEGHHPTGRAEAELQGRTVYFTGAMNASIDGERATRERATEIALKHGMLVVKGVTKKLDYLVMADPDSLSGKAQKARKYGTRILAESVFWPLQQNLWVSSGSGSRPSWW